MVNIAEFRQQVDEFHEASSDEDEVDQYSLDPPPQDHGPHRT